MAEFGAILCSNPGCGQHDFLPYKCPACGRVFCLDHMAIGSGHDCDQGEAYLASRRDEGGRSASSASSSRPVNQHQHIQNHQGQQHDERGSSQPQGRRQESHPLLSVSKPSEVMSAVTSRFDGREDELNTTVSHFNIKTSVGQAGEGSSGAPDKLLKSSQLAVDKAATAKGKRVSTQVHRMLLKAKAVGDKKLRMEDRYFLEVHYCGNDADVHHLFFSRLWTVGRTLDEILKTRRRHLRLQPEEERLPLELVRADSSRGLPTGGILNDLSPDQLQSFDIVTVRPRVLSPVGPLTGSAATTAVGESSSSSSSSSSRLSPTTATNVPGLHLEGATAGRPSGTIEPLSSSNDKVLGTGGADSRQQHQEGHPRSGDIAAAVPMATGVGRADRHGARETGGREARGAEKVGSGAELDTEASGDAAATPATAARTATNTDGGADEGGGKGGEEEGRGMTIKIGHGKAVYELSGILSDRVSVLDLKRRLEPLTGVPFLRQKLLFKGVLRDSDKLATTKVVEGAKVMLLGTATTAAASRGSRS